MDFQHLPFDKLVELTAHATRLTQVLRAEQVAAYTLFVYDWLLTFKTERELLAGSGFTPVRLAYFFCRYWPLVMHPVTIWAQVTVSDFKQCADIFRRPLYLTTFNFVGAALVLLVRLYGFNGGRLLPVFVLAAAMLSVVVFQLYVAATKTMLAPFAPACFPTDKEMGARWLSGYFLAPLLWDMLIMLVFIYTAVRQRLRVSLATGVVRVFVNEGLMYFFAIASVHGVNTILSYQSDVVISGSLVPMSMILPNLLTCRLIINLRRAAAASTRTLETYMEPTYPVPLRGAVHFLPLPLRRPNNVGNRPQEEKITAVPVSALGASGWFSGSTTFQTTSTGISFVDHSQALALAPPLPTPLSEIRLTDQREFVHVRKNGMWETFNASVSGSDMGSLGVRSDSGTGSFALSFDTTSSFTGTAGARSGTSSSTGTAYRSEDGGQVLLAPPVDSSRRWHWSPRLKLFGHPSHRREPPSTPSSSAFPASVHQSSVFTPTASTLSNTSTISPAQRWPADVHTAGYLDVATPVSPLRQRAPVQGGSVAQSRAVSARVERPRLASVAEHETDSRAAMMSIGYSSTFSPLLDVPRSGDRGLHYPFGGLDVNGQSE